MGKLFIFFLSNKKFELKMWRIVLSFSISSSFDFKLFKIYVTFSFPNCDPLSFLNPLKLIKEQLKLSIIKIASLNIKSNFFSIK